MPKDEFDFDDPLELNGLAFPTEEDTTEVMCECFIEEFMRMGYNAKQVLALFRNPHYLGMHMVWERHGEQFVRQRIELIFARWGRGVAWPTEQQSPSAATARLAPAAASDTGAANVDLTLVDPMGAPIPRLDP